MSEELEIILRAIDNVSDIFSSITSSAESMGESLSDVGETATDGFDEMESNIESVGDSFEEISTGAESAGDSVSDFAELTDEELAYMAGEIDDMPDGFYECAGAVGEFATAVNEVDGSSFDDAATSADELGSAAEDAASGAESAGTAIQGVDGSGFNEAAGAADDLEREVNEADQEVQNLSNDLGVINSGVLLQTADQIKGIGTNSESMAQGINTASISVGQLSTITGIAEPQMVSLINTISNATFPQEEAMLYVKSLAQIGVESENLGRSATNLDKMNDAFGLGADMTNRLGQELSVLGVDANNLETSFNALAYANANTVGGMQAFFSFLQKFDAQFKELGLDVDQTAVLIAAATHKFGGGKAAYSGLNEAIKNSNGNLRELEKSLDLAPGSLDNAKEATAQYEGQLEQLASEEAQHKTILDQLGAAWEDVSLKLAPVLGPLASAIGLIGQLGGFGIQINGLKQLASTFRPLLVSVSNYAAGLLGLSAAESAEAAAATAGNVAKDAEVVANEAVGASATGAAAGESLMLWPLLLIIAAIVALVAIVYEVGKAFGWWDDVGGMIDAIWAGIQRLWSAFINHPDVQAAIQMITSALQWLWGALQKAGQAVMEFFGVSTSGEFDIIHTSIVILGKAWDALKGAIMPVIEVMIMLWNASEPIRSLFISLIELVGGQIIEAFMTWVGIITTVFTAVSQLVQIFQLFMDGQISLPTALSMVWNVLATMFTTILSLIINYVMSWATSLWNWAVQAASGFVNNIIQFVSQLPGRILQLLVLVLTYIVQQTQNWINRARAAAQQLVSQVISYLSQLPGRALSVLIRVVSSIVSAGAQWVSNAKQKAKEVVDGAYNTLAQLPGKVASALSGVVNAIVKPFQDAYNQVKAWWDKIVNLANNVPHPAAGGELAAGYDLSTGETFDITTGQATVDVTGDIDINLNVDGLPENVSTEQVSEIFDRMINDPNFKDELIRQIASSKLFQKLDAKEKDRLLRINNRARGV